MRHVVRGACRIKRPRAGADQNPNLLKIDPKSLIGAVWSLQIVQCALESEIKVYAQIRYIEKEQNRRRIGHCHRVFMTPIKPDERKHPIFAKTALADIGTEDGEELVLGGECGSCFTQDD